MAASTWRIYYHDGSTFTGTDGGPQDAPGLGVAVIAQWDAGLGRAEILHGDGPRVIDWYWWEAGSWLGGDMAGLIQYLAAPGWKKILAGRNLPNEAFREVMRRVAADPLG